MFACSATKPASPSTAAWRTRSSPTGCSSPCSPWSFVWSSTRSRVSLHLPCPPASLLLTFPPPPPPHCRCVRLPDLRTGSCLRYFNVLPRKRRGHHHFQIAFWHFDHHHLSYHPSSGEVRDATVDRRRSALPVCVDFVSLWGQVGHPEPGGAPPKESQRSGHQVLWESLQSPSDCDLDQRHASHRHVCPRHERGHQRHRGDQRLLHLYLPWCVTLCWNDVEWTGLGLYMMSCSVFTGLCLVFTMETEAVTHTVRWICYFF